MRDLKEMVREMTLEEKAGLCSGKDFWTTKAVERLGIPSVMMTDGPHGLRKQEGESDHLGLNESVVAVCFPAACATASSFDTELLQNMGSILGEECQAEDISILLGPGVNIKRSPLCGRNFEYFSEDPYLTGKLATAYIKGVQGRGVGTSMKHFAANNQEYNRMTCSSEIDERTLHEIYLPGFEEAVKEGKPKTVMCSYNMINGTYSSENKELLTDILRERWGFDGFVMTDWGAVADRVKGIRAGLDLEMPSSGGINDAKIAAAVKNGELDEQFLDQAVENILKVLFFYVDNRHSEAVFDRDADHEKATDIETECAVLLKNEGVLPLKQDMKVAYIGGFADKPRYQGGGSSHINASKVVSAMDAAEKKGRKVTYAKGFSTKEDITDMEEIKRSAALAAAADVAVIFAGLPDSFESEGYDRKNMAIPACQNTLIEEVCKVQKNVVVILHNGSPVEMPWADKVSAVLEMYLGGQGVGEACDRLLFGEANPCGHLAETFPLRMQDNPSYLNFPGDGKRVHYQEGIYVGYRYYDKKELPVRYAFGHGLSYTTFAYGNMRVSSADMDENGEAEISVDITNTGSIEGKEVVQLYISDLGGQSYRPVKELKGFQKILLKPGETKTVHFCIRPRDLSYYDVDIHDWYAKTGTYRLMVGSASDQIKAEKTIEYHAIRTLPFKVTGNSTIGELMAQPELQPIMQQFLQFGNQEETLAGETGTVTKEMMEAMVTGTPLKTMMSFSGPEKALEIEKMIDEMNKLLEQ